MDDRPDSSRSGELARPKSEKSGLNLFKIARISLGGFMAMIVVVRHVMVGH
jgi:hypothetical protein